MRKSHRLYKTNRAPDFDHEHDRFARTRQMYDTIDRQPYQWLVVFVAGVGFFLDGYTLFASNIALPMIAYVYWQDDISSIKSIFINIATLAGTVFGELLFGFLADKNGRKMMYGIELTLLIISTIFVVMASTGVESMNVYAMLICWRFMVGIGVGGDYPLSAVITSEFAPTKHRAQMLATVFFMQPLGQTASNIITLIVVAVSRRQGDTDLTRTVDIMWRWVIGTGVIPGIVALCFRFAIPETPRFLIEIEEIPIKGVLDTAILFGDSTTGPAMIRPELERGNWDHVELPAMLEINPSMDEEDISTIRSDHTATHPANLNSPYRRAKADIIQYFWTEGNWRTLVGTSLAWLLVDFGFYGIGLSSPQFLAKTWGSLNITGPAPQWMINDTPGASIYDMFFSTSVHALVILNTGSCIGGLLLVFFSYQLNRVSLQKYGFLTLAALFIAMGTMFITVHTEGPVVVVLYIFGQLLFNFGPNGTTYIIPAEVFPTRYRATCHGISAASGKFGSILAQIFSAYYKFSFSPGDAQTTRYGWILIIFSAAMILGAVVTHLWIPPIQRGNEHSKLWGGKTETLETLALGRLGMRTRYVV